MEEYDENLKKKSHKLHTEKNKFSKKKGVYDIKWHTINSKEENTKRKTI